MSLTDLVFVQQGSAAGRPVSPIGKIRGWWAQDTGMLSLWDGAAWVDIGPLAGGAVTSVFGRTGAVIAVLGDYDTSLVPDTTDARYVTDDEKDAADAANTPSGANPFATIADLTGGAGVGPSLDRIALLTASGSTVTAGSSSQLSWSFVFGSLAVDLTDPTAPKLDPGIYICAILVAVAPDSAAGSADIATLSFGYDDSFGTGISATLSAQTVTLVATSDFSITGGGPAMFTDIGSLGATIDASESLVDVDVNGGSLVIVSLS